MKKLLFLSVGLLVITAQLYGQQDVKAMSINGGSLPKNYIKINATALLLKNYSIQYERVMTKKVSLALAYRIMPTTNIPFKDKILEYVDSEDENVQSIISNTNFNNYAITPEVRFYLGKKGYGRGLYIATYYRYANFNMDNIQADFEDDEDETTTTIVASGKATSHTVGFLVGAQWALSKHICLDWWILGPHAGFGHGNFEALPSTAISENVQQDIREELEDIDIPMTKHTVEVSSNRVAMTFDGPWAGIRAGISLGIRF